MAKTVKLSKGLDIRLQGTADKSLIASTLITNKYAVKPTDFYGLTPKLSVEEGALVKAGSPLFFDKHNPRVIITSPVSGKVTEIRRGAKRVIEAVLIEADKEQQHISFQQANPEQLTKEAITEELLSSGLWACIRQRPFNIIANPDQEPKAIVVSVFDTAPMAPDYDIIAHGQGNEFQTGLNALKKLTNGKLHLNIHTTNTCSDVFLNSKNVEINKFSGPHPAGNVGVQIHHIDPINKGENVWHVNAQDVIIIGRLFLEGRYDSTKIIALAGSELKRTGYHKVLSGACIDKLIENNIDENATDVRYISGNVLTGTQIAADGYLGFYDHMISVIPEGNHYEFAGWAMPGLNKFSFSRTFFSWLRPGHQYKLDTNLNGGRRAFVLTGQFEQVLPMNIYPLQLIKACIIEDLESMENLGIYEVDPEDFALCEYIDTSKTEIQEIIRNGQELIRREMF